MAQTRSKVGVGAGPGVSTSAASKPPPQCASQSRYTLASESPKPPKLFILPKKATSEARIVSLLNPRYCKPTRYLVCPETGIYEFTRIAAPKSTPRSWLIECEPGETGDPSRTGNDDDFGAYVTSGAELYIATPLDPVFLVLPALQGKKTSSPEGKQLFLSSEHHLESLSSDDDAALSPHISQVLRWPRVRRLLESRMEAICDTVEAGDETMFRLSADKLLALIVAKALRASETVLPPSMEERFVVKVLDAPVLSREQDVTAAVAVQREETAGLEGLSSESVTSTSKTTDPESQSSAASTETTTTTTTTGSLDSEPSTVATTVTEETTVTTKELVAAMTASPQVIKLQRLRTAFSFICSSYIAPAQAASLAQALSAQRSLVDFAPLDEYLAQVCKLRQDAVASRSVVDYSRKRILDEEELAERAEKKRRKEADECRNKAGESRAVRDLKKVSTVGMKKMSAFFKKK